jgi:hypothetical protein
MVRGGRAPGILNPGTRCRQVVSFTPRLLYSGERAPGTRVGVRVYLDVVAKKKVSFPIPAGNRTPAVQLRNLVTLLLQLPEALSD